MTSTIERDFIVKNGLASFLMKEYPNYCGIKDIGYISHGEWADAELEYKGELFNENVVSCGKDLLKNSLIKMEITKRLISICMTIKTKCMSY